MNKPIKQTVYLPVQENIIFHTEHFKKKEGYFFTPEQLNEYTQTVIKQTLEAAAENVSLLEDGKKVPYPRYIIEEGNHYSQTEIDVDKQSIINTAEETFNKLKV